MSPQWAIWTLREIDALLLEDLDLARAGVAGRPGVGHDRRAGLDARPGGRAVDLLDVLVHARLVGGALDEGGLDVGPLDPLLDVGDEELGDLVGIAVHEELGQVVVGVDPGAGDDLKAGLLGDPLHEVDVAAEEHRGRLADRLDAEVDRGLRLSHGDVVVLARRDLVRRLLLGGAGLRPLVVDGLVAGCAGARGSASSRAPPPRPSRSPSIPAPFGAKPMEPSLKRPPVDAACIPERRGWDSNPRGGLTRPLAFQASSLSHSDTSPGCRGV